MGRLENGSPFIVMEYLEGADLAQRLEQRGPLPVSDAVDFVIQALDAVADAHVLGIIHRDIKPSNLFVVRQSDGLESVKVLDFGLSKMSGVVGMRMTHTAVVMGSPYYMSPEQMESASRADARSDIWALGVTLFQLLCNAVPFGGNTLPELCLRVVNQPVPRLHELRPAVPTGLAVVVERCVAKEPADRYANVGELALALAPFGSERGRIAARRVATVAGCVVESGSSAASFPAPEGVGAAVFASALLHAAEGADAAVSAPACAGAETAAPWSQTSVRRTRRSHRSLSLLCTAGLVAVVAGAYAWWRVAGNVSPRTVRAGESIVLGGPGPTPPEGHPAGAALHQSGQVAAGELSVPSRAVLDAPVASARSQLPARQSQRGDARRAREDSAPGASAEMRRAPVTPSAEMPPSGGITDYGDRT